MSKEPGVLTGEYRRLFQHGKMKVEGSVGLLERAGDNNHIRGHINATAGFDLDENWRTKLRLYRASDDTYLRKLNLDSAWSLRSEAVAEYFKERSYASISGFAVQELRDDVSNDATPVVLPSVNYNYASRPSASGFWTVDANANALFRSDGTESRRASLSGGWNMPYRTSTGHLLDASLKSPGGRVFRRPRPDRRPHRKRRHRQIRPHGGRGMAVPAGAQRCWRQLGRRAYGVCGHCAGQSEPEEDTQRG